MSIIVLKEFIELNIIGHDYNKCEICGKKIMYCKCFFEYKNFQDEYKFLCCSKNYQHEFDEKLKEQLFNT